MSANGPSYEVSFNGSLWFGGGPDGTPSTLALVEPELHEPALAANVLGDDPRVVVCETRPDRRFVMELVEQVRTHRVERLWAIGAGSLLDAAKLVARHVEDLPGQTVELVFIPCGAEPYRAVARFAVVDDDGERPTVVDERFARASVVLVPELLELVPVPTLACHSLDTTVHAIESLLSRLSHPYSRVQAMGALRTIAEESPGLGEAGGEARARLVVAAFLATEAFTSTRLGLAHAVASPLGTKLGVTHDALNGVLGEAVVRFWGADVQGFDDVALALGLEPSVAALCSWLDSLREAADLPASLRDLGVPWASVEAILPRAAGSSGIAVLPEPLAESGLVDFARRGWAGSRDEEVLHAEPV